jgi:TonB family protein
MGRVWLIAMLVAAQAGFAGGQQGETAKTPAPTETGQSPVKVYAPQSGVKAPKLLALTPPLELTKHCERHLDGETLLTVLVDTSGVARNAMFYRPAGSAVDAFALKIASLDRFEPGRRAGKPAVVAEFLRLKLQLCVVAERAEGGRTLIRWTLRSQPRQKLEKPKNPPQEAILAPLNAEGDEKTRKVERPDYFGGDVSAPVILYSVEAPYTPSPKGAGKGGVCEVGLVVDEHGMPRDLHIVKSLDPGLDTSALFTVNAYRFFPAIKNGEEPVPVAFVVSVKFAPPGAALASDGQQ